MTKQIVKYSLGLLFVVLIGWVVWGLVSFLPTKVPASITSEQTPLVTTPDSNLSNIGVSTQARVVNPALWVIGLGIVGLASVVAIKNGGLGVTGKAGIMKEWLGRMFASKTGIVSSWPAVASIFGFLTFVGSAVLAYEVLPSEKQNLLLTPGAGLLFLVVMGIAFFATMNEPRGCGKFLVVMAITMFVATGGLWVIANRPEAGEVSAPSTTTSSTAKNRGTKEGGNVEDSTITQSRVLTAENPEWEVAIPGKYSWQTELEGRCVRLEVVFLSSGGRETFRDEIMSCPWKEFVFPNHPRWGEVRVRYSAIDSAIDQEPTRVTLHQWIP